MTGISESVDLDISAALRKVEQLQAAVGKAGKVNVSVESTGLSSASSALKGVGTEARNVESAAGGAANVMGKLGGEAKNLAGSVAGQLSPALGQAQGHIGQITGLVGEAGGGMLAFGAGVAAVGLIVGKMTLDGVGDFIKLAGAVRSVQRVSGATAEDASHLVAIMNALGVPVEAGSAAFFKLSRTIAQHAGALEADGIEIVRNKNGNVNLTETLFSVADAYQKSGRGAEGNKILFDAFGRSGAALIPVLSQNKEQLEEFYRAAEKHHEILSQDDLDMARTYKLAVHDLGESWTGLERELGAGVIPILTTLAHALTTAVEQVDSATAAVGGVGNVAKSLVTSLNPVAIGVNAVSGATKALHGDFLGAVETGVPVVHLLTGLFGSSNDAASAAEDLAEAEKQAVVTTAAIGSVSGVAAERIALLAQTMDIDLVTATDKEKKQLAEAAAKLNEAITPTQRLTADSKVLGYEFSTVAENVKAFKDALDAALGSYLDVDEANIHVRQSIASLSGEVAKGQEKTESYGQFQDRVSSSTIALVRSIEAQEQAMVKSGQLTDDAATQQQYLQGALLAVANVATPAVREQILGYVNDLGLILPAASVASTASIDVNTSPAESKLAGLLDGINVVYNSFGQLAAATADVNNAFGQPAGAANLTGQEFSDTVAARAKAAGDRAGKAFSDAIGGARAVSDAAAAGARTGQAAADKAAKTVETTLLRASGPGEGLDIGGFIVNASVLGIHAGTPAAVAAALDLAIGVKNVTDRVRLLDPSQQQQVLKGVEDVEKRTKDLDETRKKLGSDSIEAKIAEMELGAAQDDLRRTIRDATSDTTAYLRALEKQKQRQGDLVSSLGRVREAYADVNTVARAQRDLLQAERDRNDLLARQAELPGLIAAAQSKLANQQTADAKVTAREDLAVVQARKNVLDAQDKLNKVNADGTATDLDRQEAADQLLVAQEDLANAIADTTAASEDAKQAAQDLADLQKEQIDVAGRLQDATDRVTDSENSLIDAQIKLLDAGQNFADFGPQLESVFRSIATQAGLTAGQIDAMVGSLRDANNVARGVPGRTFDPSGPPTMTANGQVAVNPDTIIPLPGGGSDTAGDLANRGALRLGNDGRPLVDAGSSIMVNGNAVNAGLFATPLPNYGAGGGSSAPLSAGNTITANFYPLTAQFDQQAVVTYLRALEAASA